MNKKKDYQLTNPFSEDFLKIWEIWKEYKWASHNFRYKSVFSEQAALEQLWTLSKADEEVAAKIIKQSMRREWQGLFPLHETTTGDGKSTKQSTPKAGETRDQRISDVQAELNKRYGGGKSGDGESHLKAV